jgi:hypothetical protein
MQLKQKLTSLLHKAISYGLILAILTVNSPILTQAASLATGVDTLGDSAIEAASSHSIAFTTQTNLTTGDRIELYFPDFAVNLTDNSDITVATGPTTAIINYNNLDKKITLTLTNNFNAGSVVVAIVSEKITSPAVEGEYSIGILTRDASNGYSVLDNGIATVGVANNFVVTITILQNRHGGWYDIPSPELRKVEIRDTAGVTRDTTPAIKITAINSPTYISLSCNAGANWSGWMTYPNDDELNTGDTTEFDITTGAGCDTTAGVKTITVKLKNSYGSESIWESDSTIYEIAEVTHSAADETPTTPSTTTSTSTVTVPLSAEAIGVNKRLIEVGYMNPYQVWQSFLDMTINSVDNTATVEAPKNILLETRVIPAVILDNQTSSLTTAKPILVNESGKTSVGVELTSNLGVTVRIPAATTITDNETGEIYNRVIYPPEAVMNPPVGSGISFKVTNAVFVGSSSTDLNFDKPVTITFPVGEDISNPKIFYFDEAVGDWLLAVDAITGEAGGVVSADGKTISITVDHMTIFSVIGASKDILEIFLKKLTESVSAEKITHITAGPDKTERNSWNAEKWISPADTGGDEEVSFAWNSGERSFAYEFDLNPEANSVTEDSPITVNPFVDNLKLTEGSNYLHLQAIDSAGIRSAEKVFVLNYDKTPPRLLSANIEILDKNFAVGDTVNFTLHFSEPITTPDILTAYFSFGNVVEIPALKTPTEFISGSFVLKNINDSYKDALTSLVGIIIDRAGLIDINPTPSESGITLDGGIHNPRLIVKIPAVAASGKYFTTENKITLLPIAEGAMLMRIQSEALTTEKNPTVKLGEWMPYTQSAVNLEITPDLGAKKIMVNFTNKSGIIRSAGIIITRIPASGAELIASELVWEGLAKIMRSKAGVELEQLITEGLSETYRKISAENPNFNPTIISNVTIENLNTGLDIAKEIRALVTSGGFSIPALSSALERLNDLGCKLTTFFTPEEISQLFSKIDTTNLAEVAKYIDLTIASVEKNAAGNIIVSGQSLGLRDSDGDGLSDKKELLLATNPYSADSDLDGWNDGVEVLDFGSNPLSADAQIPTGFSNLKDGMILADPRPILHGGATPGEKLTITAIAENQQALTLGNTAVDESGKWLLIPEVVLPSGKYIFQLTSTTERKLLAEVAVEINLDFILLPPELYLNSDALVFANSQPEFYGNTFYGNTVVATFQSEISSAAVIADNASGDFVIRPPKPLEAGSHTLIIYSELPDGTRSPARIINFEIAGEKHAAASILHLPSREDAVLGGIVVTAIFGTFYFLSRRRKGLSTQD